MKIEGNRRWRACGGVGRYCFHKQVNSTNASRILGDFQSSSSLLLPLHQVGKLDSCDNSVSVHHYCFPCIRQFGPGRPGWFPTQAPHRSGRVEQETHLVTPPRPTSQVPIIGFSALLQLVEWYQVRLRRNQQGGSSCVDPQPPLSPPAPDQGSPSPQSAPALAQLDRRIPRANPGHPQSRRGPAARSASSHPGGDQ